MGASIDRRRERRLAGGACRVTNEPRDDSTWCSRSTAFALLRAAATGAWTTREARQPRAPRAVLPPASRCQLNIIRNWVGQNTEETFYDLADEYGMMVWNDFWDPHRTTIRGRGSRTCSSTTPATVVRFRNHPSIVVWCGRNEGVPQPIDQQGTR